MAFSNPQSLKPEEKEKVVEKGRMPNLSIQHLFIHDLLIWRYTSKSSRLRHYSHFVPKCAIINQLNSCNSKNRSERSGEDDIKDGSVVEGLRDDKQNALSGDRKEALERLLLLPPKPSPRGPWHLNANCSQWIYG